MEYKEETKNCQNCKKDFIIEINDFSFYEKIKVPPPTWCPECRMIRRMAFRDQRSLYKRKSDKTGQTIFSIFNPKSPVQVWEQDIWWSDKWDGTDYGLDIDFNRSFLEQLKELFYKVPLPSQTGWDMINSDYSGGSTNLKNCYLVFVTTNAEDCMYSVEMNNTKNSIDVTRIESSELCYNSFSLTKCYRTFYSSHCENCLDTWFSRGLNGCSSCFGCTNLNKKQYHIFNEPYSKEDYENKIKEFNTGSYESIRKIEKTVDEIINKSIRRFAEGHYNLNVTGDYINNSKNVFGSYYVTQVEDSKYVQLFFTPKAKDCYDCTMWGANTELCYECSSIGSDSSNIKFSCRSYKGANDCEYSLYCIGCSHIFGCSGLKYKKYCILNKQYTKDEYEKIIPEVKKQMLEIPYVDSNGRVYKYGEFFPLEFSAFSYNDSIECLHHKEKNHLKLNCDSSCTEAFKITEAELSFYKRLNLSVPRLCPNCRYYNRLKQRNSMKLWHRKCMKEGCNNEFETSYAPERPEIIYCEKCYQQEVY